MTLMTLLRLVRAPAGLTAMSNILAAAIIVSAGALSIEVIYLILGSVAFYFAGMTINDCFDHKQDAIERNNRPIPSGAISLFNAWLMGAGLLILGLGLTLLHSINAFYIGLILSLCILLYNGLIKNGLHGSICMASCRYFNWLLGASFFALSLNSFFLALPIFFYIVGLTFLSKQEELAENKNSIFFTAAMLLCTCLAFIFLIQQVLELTPAQMLIAYSLISFWFAMQLKKLRQVFLQFTPDNVKAMISWLVIGVIPLDALLVAISGHYLLALGILALLPACRYLNKHLYVT